jgi:hypothetical protein
LGAILEGEVYDSAHARPLVGAGVLLAGTPYEGITRASGVFHLEGLPEGEYALLLFDPAFPAWGRLPALSRVSLHTGERVHVSLAVPSTASLFRLVCPAADDTLGAIAGVVRDSLSGRPVRDAVIQLAWEGYDVFKPGMISGHKRRLEVGSDSTGYFRGCGVPARTTIQVRVTSGVREGPPVELRVERGEVLGVTLTR